MKSLPLCGAPVAGLLVLMAAAGCRSLSRPAAPRWVSVGSVQVDTANREIRVTGSINLDHGMIELLACGPAGKTHESLLVLTVEPVDLQAAMLLLGLEPGIDPLDLGVGRPTGPELDLWVEWDTDHGPREMRAEHLVWHRGTRRPLPATGWVFTGSQVVDGIFMADHNQSLIATFWEPWAILNLPLPCGADDTLLEVHRDAVPPRGTPVRLRASLRP